MLGCWFGGKAQTADAAPVHRAIKKMTDIIVHDVFSPPVASRTYAYISVAAYEAGRHASAGYPSLVNRLHGFTTVASPQAGKKYDFGIAACHALLLVGKAMVVSEDSIQQYDDRFMAALKKRVPNDVWARSKTYGEQVAKDILAWAAKDRYKETRSMPRYEVTDDPSTWKPTAPAYMKAVEPHWLHMRTFVIDSAQQFTPPVIPVFSTAKGSPFYEMVYEVYQESKALTDEKEAMANFWDCNPFKMNVKGHVMFATKKISPGGHWMNITALACQQTKADMVRSLDAYCTVAVTLADAFIICWAEKYKSNVIRPETYINNYIDGDWVPLLQTPPFPEYTSGHSVVSAAAARMLTGLFGDGFAFTDNTEMEFGLTARSFPSFNAAAAEAAISRMYGGIHYRPAIEYGLTEGTAMADLVWQRLRVK